jgi:lipopolysaccharide export LptBFGC system permease protein LptF
MAKRWWQYEKRPLSQVLRVTAHLWAAFTLTVVIASFSARNERSTTIAAGATGASIAGYFYRRAQMAERREAKEA